MTILVGVVSAPRRGGLLRDARRAALGVVLIGLLLTLVFSFFFTSVAANAIAITARNPVSGMTMLTIIVSSVVLLRFGLSGHDRDVLRDGDRGHGLHGARRSRARPSPT